MEDWAINGRSTTRFWWLQYSQQFASYLQGGFRNELANERVANVGFERADSFDRAQRAQDDVGHHVEEERVVVDGFRANHRQPDLAAHLRRFMVEVVEHLEVVGDEADRADEDVPDAAVAQRHVGQRERRELPPLALPPQFGAGTSTPARLKASSSPRAQESL